MGEVVDLNPKVPIGWWTCGCGCQTFYVRSDSELECAQCDKVVKDVGYWRVPETDEGPRPQLLGEPTVVSIVFSEHSQDTFDHILRFAKPAGTVALVVIQQNGDVHTWGDIPRTRAQRGWLRRKLELARRTIIGNPS